MIGGYKGRRVVTRSFPSVTWECRLVCVADWTDRNAVKNAFPRGAWERVKRVNE